ncbi:hypothetical protein MN032_11385 [Agromyces atrinae]|uniref:Uncharacterized protein n=1 Tax=Agromyces atrinae TaxID=592376 RepID=A0A852SFJ2_9MICO|nr:hypothetical protein [Agromyces atrinae]MCI2958300.1 hypothetical protein [Agromyces atrinae]NYD66485.1 hypothetical protein [Agromyces atrinae]
MAHLELAREYLELREANGHPSPPDAEHAAIELTRDHSEEELRGLIKEERNVLEGE